MARTLLNAAPRSNQDDVSRLLMLLYLYYKPDYKLEQILDSWSWWLTAPLRRVFEWLSKILSTLRVQA